MYAPGQRPGASAYPAPPLGAPPAPGDTAAPMPGEGLEQLAQALDLVRRHRSAPSTTDAQLLATHPELRELLEPLLSENDAAPAPPDERVLGDFRLLRPIGRGGMGEVYEAVQRSLGRHVALKVLPAGRAESPAALARFQREAQLLATLRHDHLVAVHAIGEAAGQHFFAMDLVDGTTLAKGIERLREVPPAERDGHALANALRVELNDATAGARLVARDHVAAAIGCLLPVAEALAHVHQHGVVHRDVKPANILLRRDGAPLLSDFGLARSDDAPGFTQTGDFAGTPHYVAPEQIAGGSKNVDERTDVFALGVSLFELLTLHRPFDAPTTQAVLHRVLRAPPPDPKRFGTTLPDDLLAVLDKALQKDPAERYPNMAAFAGDLRALRDLRAVSVRRPGPFTRLRRYAKREPLRASFVAVLALLVPALLGLGIYLAVQQPRIAAAAARERDQQIEELLEGGYLELGDGNPHVAVRRFLAAEQVDAGRPETLVGLVLAFDRLGRREDMACARDRLGATHTHLREELLGMASDVAAGAAAHRAIEPTVAGTPVDALGCYVRGMRWLGYAHSTGNDGAYRRAADLLDECIARTPIARALYHCQYLHTVTHLCDTAAIEKWVGIVEQQWPRSPIATYWRGFALEKVDRERARQLLGAVVKERDELILAHCALARILADDDRGSDARQAYEQALAKSADHPVALWGLARALVRLKDPGAALEVADRALKIAPDESMGHAARGAALLDLERAEEGLAAVDRSIELTRGSSEYHILRCRLLTALGRPEEAIAAATEAARLDPRDCEPHIVANAAHVAAGDVAGARAALERAVALKPGHAAAWHELGWHCITLKEAAAARAAFEQFLRLEPENAEAHGAMGLWHKKHGERATAKKHFERALELDPQLTQARVNLASLLWELGDREGSMQCYREAAQRAPDHEVACDGFVWALQETGRGAEAIAERRRWAEAHASSPVAWLKLVKTCLDTRGGDLELASRAVDNADAAVGEPRADVFFWRASIEQRRGAPAADVRALYERALAAPHCSDDLKQSIDARLRALR